MKYHEDQINKAEATHDWTYNMTIQIRGNLDKTNWMDITKGQLELIRDILKVDPTE